MTLFNSVFMITFSIAGKQPVPLFILSIIAMESVGTIYRVSREYMSPSILQAVNLCIKISKKHDHISHVSLVFELWMITKNL